jgi:hypothetical protein
METPPMSKNNRRATTSHPAADAAVTKAAPEPGDRLTRAGSAVFVSERLARPVSARTLASWPIPYVRDGRIVTYSKLDLLAAVEARLAALPRCLGGGPAGGLLRRDRSEQATV